MSFGEWPSVLATAARLNHSTQINRNLALRARRTRIYTRPDDLGTPLQLATACA